MQKRYPITAKDFVEDVINHFGGKIVPLGGKLHGPRGRVDPIIISRGEGADTRFARVQDLGPNRFLTAEEIRSLCAQLGLDCELYGLEPDGTPHKPN